MASVGPNLPSAGSNNAAAGTESWTSPGNVTADDSTYAWSLSIATGARYTNYLQCNFASFAIPDGATIDGIAVDVCRYKAAGSVTDELIQLHLNGTLKGNNQADTGTEWTSGVEGVASYGGAANLWGATPSVADLNSGTYGVMVQAHMASGIELEITCYVDYVKMTVYYTAGAAAFVAHGCVC